MNVSAFGALLILPIETLLKQLEFAAPVLDIVPEPPSLWELRVIIYDCEGIPNYDSVFFVLHIIVCPSFTL